MRVRHNEKIITRDYKNITSNLINITRHLTDIRKIIISSLIIITLNFLNIPHTSALTYSDNVGIEFTFNPTINVSISGDLSIDELVPGGYSDSNIVNVNVATNNSNGYYLSANVGSSTNNPSTELRLSNYNANDGSNGSTNPIFTSLLTTDSYSSMGNDNISPNTWGYSYSLDGTNWSNYSGLPLYNTAGIKLKENYSPSNDTINFKIAAKASNTQVSGTYTNTINFIATTHPTPLSLEQSYAYYGKEKVVGTNYYSMQDMTTGICQSADINSTMTVMDIRDNNTYTIAKLADNKCWMTTNLDIAGGTALSYTDTDFDASYTLPTTDGWTVSNNKLILPASSTSGFDTDNYAYLYNSGNRSDDCSAPGCYSYYSWDTATLGSGRNITTDNTDAPYSICPKGWHLSNTRTGTNATSDFRVLMIALGGSKSIATYYDSTNPTGSTMLNRITASPNRFLRGGYYNSSALRSGGSYGYYWSATSSSSSSYARDLYFYSVRVGSSGGDNRRLGFSVRCVANY